jgi:hypothetical protein
LIFLGCQRALLSNDDIQTPFSLFCGRLALIHTRCAASIPLSFSDSMNARSLRGMRMIRFPFVFLNQTEHSIWRAAGARQIRNYEEQLGMPGRFICYHP